MKLIPSQLEFNWDDGNFNKNLDRHNVSTKEAEQLFFNTPLFLYGLPFTSEKRYKALGRSNANRKLLAIFTLRNGKIRIISIRDMSRKERNEYERA
jgi:uncharacterized DUF497 family protein